MPAIGPTQEEACDALGGLFRWLVLNCGIEYPPLPILCIPHTARKAGARATGGGTRRGRSTAPGRKRSGGAVHPRDPRERHRPSGKRRTRRRRRLVGLAVYAYVDVLGVNSNSSTLERDVGETRGLWSDQIDRAEEQGQHETTDDHTFYDMLGVPYQSVDFEPGKSLFSTN